jgi:hypothetical protein
MECTGFLFPVKSIAQKVPASFSGLGEGGGQEPFLPLVFWGA